MTRFWIKSRTHGVQAVEIRSSQRFKRRGGPSQICRGIYVNVPGVDFFCSERYLFLSEEAASLAVIDRQLPPTNENQVSKGDQ